ncbi:hypothetical protein bcere0022_49610 [Bacillus cereus Rock3-44]|nr:hypothetical protein bcere0022_49610 [Bacillus cereus Rock3-44]
MEVMNQLYEERIKSSIVIHAKKESIFKCSLFISKIMNHDFK